MKVKGTSLLSQDCPAMPIPIKKQKVEMKEEKEKKTFSGQIDSMVKWEFLCILEGCDVQHRSRLSQYFRAQHFNFRKLETVVILGQSRLAFFQVEYSGTCMQHFVSP